ncbi:MULTISPECIES: ATP12 family chaperone protein [Commensalibacter]|uniref:ATP12 chaperone protein n=2 Tax=Commensalibacter TaxID=1079922 RepID=W7E6J5_9PROT|nr:MULTISPECIES: ATP12 family protein [Commensalibacter]EUK18746.1 ATP12 chaperone protein [Commensalibacter papalotli (ex Servin-Garciduenas et al. 2014)]CAI3923798.1 Mitochondrial FoF1-type ATP synthase assembly chaperone ATP12 (Atp12) (PDB:2P4X) [Commensalibacter papalotli (ex Botero et al. 2024)]CAI3928308.1 Mitochondrial FoF1-type ATP synthase assembly chaperone ATP12 (Atp12) (PDB:2P4X) [Commensalibacter papalotli (ex Botero et al. 2024)]
MSEVIKLRRFWETVSIVHNDMGYQILLDKRPVKLPKKTELFVQNHVLAEKIAEEWGKAGAKKGDTFSFDDLPMTQITGTMIEKVAPDRQIYIQALLPYVNGDLLCYHAETPKKLIVQQQEKWIPLIKWIEDKFQIKLKIQPGIMPINQQPEVINIFERYLLQLDDAELTFFAITIPLLGSMILTIALKEGKINTQQAFKYAYLDETIQAEIWGKDTEQQERLKKINADLIDSFEFLKISKN